MDYKITIDQFEGPLDLLLHLIKQSNLDIKDISLETITQQYIDYIHTMEKLDLNIASEYLVYAAELLEIKSSSLLPKQVIEEGEEDIEDPKEKLIQRLIEYQQYKEVTKELKEMALERSEQYSKAQSDLRCYQEEKEELEPMDVSLLLEAIEKFLIRKKEEQPLPTKIAHKEYSVTIRSEEIKKILQNKKQVMLEELLEETTKDYLVVTFLSLLDLARKQELALKQDHNFSNVYIIAKEGEHETEIIH